MAHDTSVAAPMATSTTSLDVVVVPANMVSAHGVTTRHDDVVTQLTALVPSRDKLEVCVHVDPLSTLARPSSSPAVHSVVVTHAIAVNVVPFVTTAIEVTTSLVKVTTDPVVVAERQVLADTHDTEVKLVVPSTVDRVCHPLW